MTATEKSLTEQRDQAWSDRDRLYCALERLYRSWKSTDAIELALAREGARGALGLDV